MCLLLLLAFVVVPELASLAVAAYMVALVSETSARCLQRGTPCGNINFSIFNHMVATDKCSPVDFSHATFTEGV